MHHKYTIYIINHALEVVMPSSTQDYTLNDVTIIAHAQNYSKAHKFIIIPKNRPLYFPY